MNKLVLRPIDRISLFIMAVLMLVIGGFIIGEKNCGSQCLLRKGPRVKSLTWQNKQIGAKDRAFILTFDRPMDTVSVEKNLLIDPPVSGQFSWAGRRLAYTLKNPIPYGQTYQIHLSGARERFRQQGQPGEVMEPFVGELKRRRKTGFL
jgi:hypothetical protein